MASITTRSFHTLTLAVTVLFSCTHLAQAQRGGSYPVSVPCTYQGYDSTGGCGRYADLGGSTFQSYCGPTGFCGEGGAKCSNSVNPPDGYNQCRGFCTNIFEGLPACSGDYPRVNLPPNSPCSSAAECASGRCPPSNLCGCPSDCPFNSATNTCPDSCPDADDLTCQLRNAVKALCPGDFSTDVILPLVCSTATLARVRAAVLAISITNPVLGGAIATTLAVATGVCLGVGGVNTVLAGACALSNRLGLPVFQGCLQERSSSELVSRASLDIVGKTTAANIKRGDACTDFLDATAELASICGTNLASVCAGDRPSSSNGILPEYDAFLPSFNELCASGDLTSLDNYIAAVCSARSQIQNDPAACSGVSPPGPSQQTFAKRVLKQITAKVKMR